MKMENAKPQVHGAGGGGGGKSPKVSQNIEQNVTIVNPSRKPVETPNNLFSTSFAKIVYGLSEGQIEGFPDSRVRKNIYLDGTPAENNDGSKNYDGFQYQFRTGTNGQSALSGFTTIENVIGVNSSLTKSSPLERQVTDPDVERIRVIMQFPGLLSQNVENGDIKGTSVEFTIKLSANGGPFNDVKVARVSGKSNSEFQRAYEFDLPGSGPWTIRIVRVTNDSTSGLLQNATNWLSYVEIIDEKLSYPNTAIFGLKVDAKGFNTIPNVGLKLKGVKVQVPTNYDPITRTSDGLWDGTFKIAWTDNPAWIFRDLVVNNRYGCAKFVSNISVDKWHLKSVADYCDELIDNAAGGQEPRFTCNVYLQNAGSVFQVLNAIASVFRGALYYSNGQLFVSQDRPQQPVQQFSPANVIEKVDRDGQVVSPAFTYTASARAARKTVVLADWDDPNQEYSSVKEYLQDDELLQRYGFNPVDLRLIGVTSRGQAIRACRHALFVNRYETEKVTFSVGAEGLACGVGEIIQISDPLKQGQRLGGRVVAVDEGDLVHLDAELNLVDLQTNNYTLTLLNPQGQVITNPDGTIKLEPKLTVHNVTAADNVDGKAVLTVDGSPSREAAGTIWVLEWNSLQAATYRILSVSEASNMVFQIEALQYNDSKYAVVDENALPVIPKDSFKVLPPTRVTSLAAKLVYTNSQIQIQATWAAPQINNTPDLLLRGYSVEYRAVGDEEWIEAGSSAVTSISIAVEQYVFSTQYEIRVQSLNRLGQASRWRELDVSGLDPLPNIADPSYNAVIRHANQPDGTQLLIVDSGSLPIFERVSGYRCEVRAQEVPTPIPGVKEPDENGWYFLTDIPLTGYYSLAFHAPGDYQIRVRFSSSVFGEVPSDYLYDFVDRDEIAPPTPSLFTVVQDKNSKNKRFSWSLPVSKYGSWDQGVVSDVVGYELRYKAGLFANPVQQIGEAGRVSSDPTTTKQTHTYTNAFTGLGTPVVVATQHTPSTATNISFQISDETQTGFDYRIRAAIPDDTNTSLTSSKIDYLAVLEGEHQFHNGTRISAGRFLTDSNADLDFVTILFDTPFTRQPCVVASVTSAFSGWRCVRIRNINTFGFQAAFQREEGQPNPTNEQISWIAVEAGRYDIDADHAIDAFNNLKIDDSNYDFKFSQPFVANALAFAQITSFDGMDPVNAEVSSRDRFGFTVSAAEEIADDSETIHPLELTSLFGIGRTTPGSAIASNPIAIQGSTFAPPWDRGVPLTSAGTVTATQWLETSLLDSGTWTVMLKSVDSTQWRADKPAFIVINSLNTLVDNAVDTNVIDRQTWPGALTNITLANASGSNKKLQVAANEEGKYIWNFDNNFELSNLLIEVTSDNATYEHKLGALNGASVEVSQEDGDGILQEDDSELYTEQRIYTDAELTGQGAGILHPYAPFEQLTEDAYRVETTIMTGSTTEPAEITKIKVTLDYADVFESMNDVPISNNAAGTVVNFNKTFRAIQGVQVTIQNTTANALIAEVVSKTTANVTIRLKNLAGNVVAGLVDISVNGY